MNFLITNSFINIVLTIGFFTLMDFNKFTLKRVILPFAAQKGSIRMIMNVVVGN